MTFVSYAQNFEDVMLWRALSDVQNGRYIDIGAQDPVLDSVSLGFYEHGWRGIHVEPTPTYASLLREARPDEPVVQAAVTQSPGPIEFFEVMGTGLSTARQDIARDHERNGREQRRLFVPCARLDQILEIASGEIHWMKVDVEGLEADVLRSWNAHPARPWILVVEATYPLSQRPTHEEWDGEVRIRGYEEVYYDGLSRYFVHERHADRRSAFETPPNVFDAFTVARDHFSAGELRDRIDGLDKSLSEERTVSELLRSRIAELEQRVSDEERLRFEVQSRESALVRAVDELRESLDAALRDRVRVETEHSAQLDKLWRERAAAEGELQSALQALRAREFVTRSEVARLQEQSKRLDEEGAHLRRQVSEFQFELDRVESLIHAARDEPAGWWAHVGSLLGLSQPGRAWPKLRAWELERSASTKRTKTIPDNPYLRANSLPELLSWDDLDFVRCAYVTILGRQPDADGELFYLGRLRAGQPKLQILWQLRNSPEAKSHDPGIAGLDAVLRRFRRARLPLIGRLFGSRRDLLISVGDAASYNGDTKLRHELI